MHFLHRLIAVPGHEDIHARRGSHGGMSRRQFLGTGTLAAAGLLLEFDHALGLAADGFPDGKFAGLVPFEDEQVAPAGTLLGAELDGRLFTDLAKISPDRLVTPNAEFFIRSAASSLLPVAAGWKIAIDGLVERPSQLAIDQIRKASRPTGVHLMECAGNVARTRFGLMSAAHWAGVPVADLLGEAKRKTGAGWVEISGFDEYSTPSRTSEPGASWIFPVDALKDAFLATEMNGEPLTADHGAPVRLVVPGWYGCACIKWVNRITFVEEGTEASSQMREYAIRTLQAGRPQLAKDYAPAIAGPAALPVRVEKWIVGGKIRYRIAGIAWGGIHGIGALQIRFNPLARFELVSDFKPQPTTDSWTLWTHAWSPSAPGDYQIRMAVVNSPIPARKLEMGLYDRTVHISEV